MSESPAGIFPALTSHLKPEPFAVNVWLYASPTVALGSDDVVIARSAITIVRSFDAVAVPYVALTLNVNEPEAVGMPLIVPALSVRPAGRLLVIAHVAPEGFDASEAL